MQVGDLIKPKLHLEVLKEPHREGHDLLEVHTRWGDPKEDFKIFNGHSGSSFSVAMIVGTTRVRRRDRRNKSGIATMVPKIKLLIGGQVALITKGKLDHMFESV
jgi:hypothetical protein|tara:strand:+ start:787 stop:1098 length:312 start_codon:yes stop_codon:yes gene_type:complete